MAGMDATTVIDIRSKSEPDQYRDWDEATIESAYEAWAFLDGQVCTKVAKRLADGYFVDEDGHPQYWAVPVRTVQVWVRRHDWPARRDAFFAGNFGAIRRQIAGTLLLAAVSGSAYIQAVNDGATIADRDRVTASMGALDRVGFSPVGSRDVGAVIDNAAKHAPAALPDVSSATVDELMRLERELRKRRAG